MANGDKFHGPFMSCGEVTGTGSAITVSLDFKPIAIRLINVTDNVVAYWNQALGTAYATKIVDSGSGTTDVSTVTSNGFTAGNAGFIIGTDSALNASGKTLVWEAYRGFR